MSKLRWIGTGKGRFVITGRHTIIDNADSFDVYEQIDGDEVFVGRTETIAVALEIVSEVTA